MQRKARYLEARNEIVGGRGGIRSLRHGTTAPQPRRSRRSIRVNRMRCPLTEEAHAARQVPPQIDASQSQDQIAHQGGPSCQFSRRSRNCQGRWHRGAGIRVSVQRRQAHRVRGRGPRSCGRTGGRPAAPGRHRQHADRDDGLAQDRRRHTTGGIQSGQRVARSRARRLGRPRPHHQPGRTDRRQPELAEGGPARPRAARGLHPAREDHALRPRAHPGAHRARARFGRARLLRVLRAADRSHARLALLPRPASARRCSCASPRSPASAARPTLRATCAASPSSSTPTRATGTSSATTSRCSSSRTR